VEQLGRELEVGVADGHTLEAELIADLDREERRVRNVVVFTPEDLALPRGSPGDRRRFLDRGVFNLLVASVTWPSAVTVKCRVTASPVGSESARQLRMRSRLPRT
jgi:hypothetical protein